MRPRRKATVSSDPSLVAQIACSREYQCFRTTPSFRQKAQGRFRIVTGSGETFEQKYFCKQRKRAVNFNLLEAYLADNPHAVTIDRVRDRGKTVADASPGNWGFDPAAAASRDAQPAADPALTKRDAKED